MYGWRVVFEVLAAALLLKDLLWREEWAPEPTAAEGWRFEYGLDLANGPKFKLIKYNTVLSEAQQGGAAVQLPDVVVNRVFGVRPGLHVGVVLAQTRVELARRPAVLLLGALLRFLRRSRTLCQAHPQRSLLLVVFIQHRQIECLNRRRPILHPPGTIRLQYPNLADPLIQTSRRGLPLLGIPQQIKYPFLLLILLDEVCIPLSNFQDSPLGAFSVVEGLSVDTADVADAVLFAVVAA